MRQYLDFLRHIRTAGVRKEDRTGTGTLSVFGHQMRFDLRLGFPLVTTKQLHLALDYSTSCCGFSMRGDTNVQYLQRPQGHDLGRMGRRRTAISGPVYGKQWRSAGRPRMDGDVDQLSR